MHPLNQTAAKAMKAQTIKTNISGRKLRNFAMIQAVFELQGKVFRSWNKFAA